MCGFTIFMIRCFLFVAFATSALGLQVHTGNPDDAIFRGALAPGRNCLNQVAFFHIPKTGGRAIVGALGDFVNQTLKLGNKLQAAGLSRRLKRVPWNDTDDSPIVSTDGLHAYVLEFHTREATAADILPQLKHLKTSESCGVISATVLREPIERTVSMFDYDMQTGCLPQSAAAHAKELFGNVSDQQTRFFTRGNASRYCPVCGEFWMTGRSQLCQNMTEEEQQESLRLVREEFDVVGVVDNLEGFSKQVLRRMGFREELISDFRIDVAGATEKDTADVMRELPSEWIDIIRRRGIYDFQLYEEARKRAAEYA